MKTCMMSLCMGGYSVEEIVKTTVECRMETIDWISCHGQKPGYLKHLCDDAGIKIQAHTMYSDDNLTRGVQPRESFLRSLADAVELGTHILMVPPFPDNAIASLDESKKRWLDFYGWAAPIGKAAGVQVTLESTGFLNSPIITAAEVLEVLRQVPELRLTMDCGNMATGDPDIIGGYQMLKPYIVHFHLKDWHISDSPSPKGSLTRSGRYVSDAMIGTGDLDLRGFWDQVEPAQKETMYVNLETLDDTGRLNAAQVMKSLSEKLRSW